MSDKTTQPSTRDIVELSVIFTRLGVPLPPEEWDGWKDPKETVRLLRPLTDNHFPMVRNMRGLGDEAVAQYLQQGQCSCRLTRGMKGEVSKEIHAHARTTDQAFQDADRTLKMADEIYPYRGGGDDGK